MLSAKTTMKCFGVGRSEEFHSSTIFKVIHKFFVDENAAGMHKTRVVQGFLGTTKRSGKEM